jgi:four helix bundle protein
VVGGKRMLGPESVFNLRIWQEGMVIVKESYALTYGWPKEEMFGLTAQVRRAAVSIPSNLAEGRGRGTNPEMARFAQIALGSIYELDTLFRIACDLGYMDSNASLIMQDRLSNLSRQISSFIQIKRSEA